MREIVAEPLISPLINESIDQQDYSLDVMTSTPTTPNSAHLLDQTRSSDKSNHSTSDEEPEDDYPGRNLSIEDTDLVLCDLSLDRSDDASPTDKEAPVSPLPDPVLTSKMPSRRSSKSTNSEKLQQTKRYPSFRDIFFMPLRSKRRSTQQSDHQSFGSSESTKKSKGCGGWLDKKKKKSKKIQKSDDEDENLSEESPPPLVPVEEASVSTHLMMQCSKCNKLDGRPANLNIQNSAKGATFTKCPLDGEWLCGQCTDREDGCEWSSKDRVPPLAYLAIDALKLNPQLFTLTNLAGLRRREELGDEGVEDMIAISDLNEASLLWNLKTRYDRQQIYTYTGNILVSVNPYKMFDIYGTDMVKKYENQILGTLPPHLFAIGSAAYERMTSQRDEPQVVIISGESGAGKTEATKLIMQYLAAVNNKAATATIARATGGPSSSVASSSSLVTEQILEASPLLESFGNATTVRNDNSSRFGKYTQIFFKNGVISGAKITEYLLEKSRIVTQAADERNYHVFYEILKGLRQEDKERYGLTSAENYFYLNQGGSVDSGTKNDANDYKALMSAMQILGFSPLEQDTIMRILASVLHLGNVYFNQKPMKHGQEGVSLGSDAEVRWVGHLLQLRVEGIVEALTTRITEARNERVQTPLNFDQALDARDAVAKALYSSLFGWLVNRVNSIVFKGERASSINILDIFGFEDFPENSFEQLCINYANENLQYHFNKHIFKLEQQEYAKERIEWKTITFTDNQPVINLIAKKPIGILHLLDDESNFPKATDGSFLEKCHYNHALNDLYFRPRMSSMEFGIKHYAGQVWYNADGFLEKNRDTLRPDVIDLLISSRIPMISKMFQDMKRVHESNKTINKGDGRFITMKPRTATVAARFHDSLQALLESMSKCNPWFVRCLKPNRDKSPMLFDLAVVLEQLRYTGMLETIKIRKTGFPIRMRFDQFLERYRCLLTNRERRSLLRHQQQPGPDFCRVVLERNATQSSHFQLGTSKVFLREVLERLLERRRLEKMRDAAVLIQRRVRMHLERKQFLTMRNSAVLIQAWVRRHQARKRFNTVRRGVVKAQAHFRATRQRRLYKELRDELIKRSEQQKTEQIEAKIQKTVSKQMERESKAAAGVNTLEIPAELAFIYSKLDDWQPVHTERNVVKVVGAVPASESDRTQLPSDLDHHAFTKFTNIYFKNHLWGAKKEPIQTPLLPKNSEADVTDSLAIFKLILRYTNGPKGASSFDPLTQFKREVAIGNYIVHKGIVRESLRDEIYCQICNQTWKNEDPQAVAKCWMLMSLCLSAFPPSPVLFKYLLKYVSDHAYDGYRATCQQKLMQSYAMDPPLARSYPPTIMEWKANRKCVNMALEARYPDDESRHAGVESWSTAEKLAHLLVRARGLDAGEAEGWTVSMANGDEFYDLNGQDFVLDVVAELETPPAFPVMKNGQFLNSRADESIYERRGRSSKAGTPSRQLQKNGQQAGSRQGRRSGARYQQQIGKHSADFIAHQQRAGKMSRSLDNLVHNTESGNESDVANQMGLSRSRLNDRYRSMDKLKSSSSKTQLVQRSESHRQSGPMQRPATAGGVAEWNKLGLSSSALNSRYFSQQNLKGPIRATDSDSSEPEEKPRRKKSSASRNGHQMPKRRGNLQSGDDSDGAGNLSDDLLSPSKSEEYLNGRNSSHGVANGRFIKAQTKKQSKSGAAFSSRAYIETKLTDNNKLGHSGMSDTSETVSLTSHVKRVRVPSQSSDVDQYLDDLFMPVLDGNIDEFSDARSLAASIKGWANESKEEEDLKLNIVDEIVPDLGLEEDEVDLEAFISSIKGGGKDLKDGREGYSSRDSLFHPVGISIPPGTPQQPIGLIPPSPLLMSGFYGGFPSLGLNPALNAPAGADPLLMQQNLSRAFIQSAVAQNMQIQQQLMAQNQALQQLLHSPALLDSGASSPFLLHAVSTTTTTHSKAGKKKESENGRKSTGQRRKQRRSVDGYDDDDDKQHEQSVGLGRNETDDDDEADVWRLEGTTTGVLARSASRGHADQVPPPVLPKNRRELESRPSFSSSRLVQQQQLQHQLQQQQGSSSPSAPPPPPPLPSFPIYSGGGSHPAGSLMDEFGRAKTVRIGKWRWPPAREDGQIDGAGHGQQQQQQQQPSPGSSSFLEFKMQQRLRKKSQEAAQATEGIEWDSFEMDEPDKTEKTEKSEHIDEPAVSPVKQRERSISPVRPHKEKPAGSIGKLKISSEMRAKLELVTIAHSGTRSSSQPPPSGHLSNSEPKKLEEHRKLMLQQQLGGGKWSTLEEVERITRRAASEDRATDLIKAINQRPQQETNQKARRHSEISSTTQTKSSFDTPAQRSSSPPTTYYSMMESNGGALSGAAEPRSLPYSEDSNQKTSQFDDDLAARALESIHTKLYGPLNAPFFTYNTVPWTLHVRKELFSPSESTASNPLGLHLVFCQVVQDTYNEACLRIGREDRSKMKQMLDSYGITPENATDGHHKIAFKRNVVETAKMWPLYFARLYPVTGDKQLSDVQFLAVSHSGLRLVRRESNGSNETLHVVQTYGFSDLSSVCSPRTSQLHISLRTTESAPLVFYTPRAALIRDLVNRFANEAEKEPQEYVRAVADYVTRESSLLSFRKGDVIRVVRSDNVYVDKGWMYGNADGRVGIFPADYVEPMSRLEARHHAKYRSSNQHDDSDGPMHDTSLDVVSSDGAGSRGDDPGSPTQPNDGKHSLLQFALNHFRQSPEKFDMIKSNDESKDKKKSKAAKKSKDKQPTADLPSPGTDWTWKEQVDLVKFTKSPIQASLLKLDSPDLNKMALECFASIMRYMGDYPMAKGQTEVDCVYTILMNCHEHEALRDEVYCQIMKQTTNNKSSRSDSCQRGWRLFSITAAYFSCSELLKPYLFKYLETAAYDKRRAYHGTAMVCLQNLRKTLKYGGRKNAPSIEEITAITAGRNSKRQIYRLPGGTERVINTKSTSVVQDIIEEICAIINVRSDHEMEEYSLYCIVEGDTFTMPLAREEYILDVTTALQKNQQVYYLIFCRSVWHYPMRLDNALYIEIVFNQIAPDYLEGVLLVMPGEQIPQDCVYDIAKVAALLHRAADLDHMPTMKETKYLLPKPALTVRDIKPPQWVHLVQSSWKEVEHLKPSQAKAQVLEILEKWPLFGSSFFPVVRDTDRDKLGLIDRCEYIMALNRSGVHFLDVITHETVDHHAYEEVISTRKVKSEDGLLFLDMRCGNLMQQRVTRIQTDQAHEISRLIRQYITIQQRVQQQEQTKEDAGLPASR